MSDSPYLEATTIDVALVEFTLGTMNRARIADALMLAKRMARLLVKHELAGGGERDRCVECGGESIHKHGCVWDRVLSELGLTNHVLRMNERAHLREEENEDFGPDEEDWAK